MSNYFEIIHYLSLLLIFVMGAFVVMDNHKSKNNWIYFLFTVSIIGWMVSLYFGWEYVNYAEWDAVLFWMRFAYGFSILFLSFMTLFLYSFPRPTFHLPKAVKIIFLGSIPVLFLIASFTPYINESLLIKDGVFIWDDFGPLYSLYIVDIIFNLIASAYLAISKLKKLHGIEKGKMTIVSYSYLIFVTVAVLTNVILPLFGILIIKEYSQLLILIFIIPAYYAIRRYRFFNFPNTSLNLLRNILLYLIFVLAAFLSHKLLIRYSPDISRYFIGFFSAFTALIVFQLAKKKLPILVTESFREFRNALSEFRSTIYICDTYTKLRKIIENIFVLKLNMINAKIFIIRKKKAKLDSIPIYIQDEFTEELKKYKKDVLIRDEIKFKKIKTGVRKLLLSTMRNLEAGLCMPLFSENNLIGFFVFRKKEGKATYSQEEIGEILKIEKDLEIVLMNILLKMNLQEENNLMKAIISKKTKQLRKQVKAIKGLLEQQSDLMAVTAHELRTPLSIAIFQLDEILESQVGTKSLKEDLETVNSALYSLKEMTHRLFDVQQYDLRKAKAYLKKVGMKKYIHSVHKHFIEVMKDKSISFSIEDNLKKEVACQMDESQISQVIGNLLNNAHKFATPEGGKIVLGIEAKNKHVLIKVQDNGSGVADKFKKAIFEKFRTQHPGSGIGLGLYICKKILELHNGKIWVEDVPEGGAVFYVRLPRSAE